MFNPGQTAKRAQERRRHETRIDPDRYVRELVAAQGLDAAHAFAERMHSQSEAMHKVLGDPSFSHLRLDDDPVVVRRTRAFWTQVHNIARKRAAR